MIMLDILLGVITQIPDPGQAVPPPGLDVKASTILGAVKWGCLFVCVFALLVAGARVAIAQRRESSDDHIKAVGAPLIGAILISAAGALVSWMVQT